MTITPIQRFFSTLDESSRPTYKIYLDKFFNYAKISHEDFNQLDRKDQESMIEEYIFYLRGITDKTGKYRNSYNTMFQPMKHYCIMNDVALNWDRLFKMLPKPDKLSGKQPYTDEDVKSFLDVCDNPRDLAIVHFLNSTAVRPGELYLLNVQDVTPIEDGAIVKYYAGQKAEYKVCLTPEAFDALKIYLDSRPNLKPDSPLFASKKGMIERRLSKFTLREFMKNMRYKLNPNQVRDGKRKDKAPNNAFRKRLEDIFATIEMHHKYASYLLDHNKDKQDKHYLPTISNEKLYSKFKVAIPLISVDKSQVIIAEKDDEIKTIKEEYEGAFKEKLEKQDEIIQQLFLETASAKYMAYENIYRECFGGKDPDLKKLAKLMSNEEIEDWNRIIPFVQRKKDWTIKTGSKSDKMLRDSKQKKEIQALIKSLKESGKDTSMLEIMLKDFE